MLDERLKKILDDQNFIQFFQCFDYLIKAGYDILEAFAISLKYYDGNENKIWENVAYAKTIYLDLSLENHYLNIGLLTSDISHLDGLFNIYRKKISDGMLNISDIYSSTEKIDSFCKIKLDFHRIPTILETYLWELFMKHFGYPVKTNDFKPKYTTSPFIEMQEDINRRNSGENNI